MRSLRLVYQSLILVTLYHYGQCQRYQYKVKVDRVNLEGHPKPFSDVILVKDSGTGKIEFSDNKTLNQACGSFETSQVEITDFFDREIKFSIARPGNNDVLRLTCWFSFTSHVLKTFFNDVRSQKEQMRDCGAKIEVKALYQFPKFVAGGTLTKIPHVNQFFVKLMSSDRFHYPSSFNFTHQSGPDQQPKLIFKALTFNIMQIDGDKYVLCLQDLYHVFVVRFPNVSNAKKFYAAVDEFRNTEVVCSSDWLTQEHMAAINGN